MKSAPEGENVNACAVRIDFASQNMPPGFLRLTFDEDTA